MLWLMIIGGLLGFGVLVDVIYRKKGIRNIDPEQNEMHVPSSERVYIESHLHNSRPENQNGNF
jgi:hypothetical protein